MTEIRRKKYVPYWDSPAHDADFAAVERIKRPQTKTYDERETDLMSKSRDEIIGTKYRFKDEVIVWKHNADKDKKVNDSSQVDYSERTMDKLREIVYEFDAQMDTIHRNELKEWLELKKKHAAIEKCDGKNAKVQEKAEKEIAKAKKKAEKEIAKAKKKAVKAKEKADKEIAKARKKAAKK